MTRKGLRFLRDICQWDEETRARMSEGAARWEAGANKQETQVEVVLFAWERSLTVDAEALADLRSHGFDPLGP